MASWLKINSRDVRHGGAVCAVGPTCPDCLTVVTGVQTITFARAGDEDAGGLPVLMQDQLADELDCRRRERQREMRSRHLSLRYTVYLYVGIPDLDMGFGGLRIN
jgi:hypothetical protein